MAAPDRKKYVDGVTTGKMMEVEEKVVVVVMLPLQQSKLSLRAGRAAASDDATASHFSLLFLSLPQLQYFYIFLFLRVSINILRLTASHI